LFSAASRSDEGFRSGLRMGPRYCGRFAISRRRIASGALCHHAIPSLRARLLPCPYRRCYDARFHPHHCIRAQRFAGQRPNCSST
jgi:hypothetical protein